jgi:hypothetical protein
MSYKPLDKKRTIENIIEEEDTETDEPEPILKKRIVEEEDTEIEESEDEDDILDDTSSFNPLVLVVMTHGRIPCEDDDRYSTTRIPDGMELIKISVSQEGSVNCFDPSESVDKYLINVNNRLPELLNKKLNTRVLNNIVDTFRRNHTFVYIPRIKSKLNESKRQQISDETELTDLEYISEYLEDYERGGFKINKLVSGDIIANKTYYRIFKEKNGNQASIVEMDKQISGLSSMEKIPQMKDLFSVFYPDTTYSPDDWQPLNLQRILQYYKTLGITRLILFDFSCSVYSYSSLGRAQPKLNKESIRRIRELNKHIPSGGKFNKKSCKRKSCKRKSCKRKSCKRKSCKRKSCKRKSCKRKSCKRKTCKK